MENAEYFAEFISEKLFKNGTSKICGIQSLKTGNDSVCFRWFYLFTASEYSNSDYWDDV